MGDTLVSIIIPVYNAGKYLAESIESAIAQTWTNKEIIIVDDGSTDNSLAVARGFRREGIYVLSQPNKGASAARNLGLKQAKGQYVQFLDADDLLSLDKIEKQVLDLKGSNEVLSVCSTVHFPDGKDLYSYSPDAYEERFLKNILSPADFLIRIWGGYDGLGTMIQPNAWLTPMQIIRRAGGWNEQLSLDDDGEFFCRVILNATGIVKTENVFNYYRKHSHEINLSAGKNFTRLKSLLESAISKKKVLLSRCNNSDAQNAINRQLYDVFLHSYPQYPEIYRAANNELIGKYSPAKPSLGGRLINRIAQIFGIKTALYLRYLIKSPNA